MTTSLPAPLTALATTKRKQFLCDVFTTALEGGIGYWSSCSVYHWHDASSDDRLASDIDGFNAVIHPTESYWGVWDDERDAAAMIIDITVMERGVRKFGRYCRGELDRHGNPVPEENQVPLSDGHYWRQWLVAEATNGEEGDYDADVADQIVQWGLFGKAIYG